MNGGYSVKECRLFHFMHLVRCFKHDHLVKLIKLTARASRTARILDPSHNCTCLILATTRTKYSELTYTEMNLTQRSRKCTDILIKRPTLAKGLQVFKISLWQKPRSIFSLPNDFIQLQSSQVKRTPQGPFNEFVIQKLNPSVVVDFRFISAFLHA